MSKRRKKQTVPAKPPVEQIVIEDSRSMPQNMAHMMDASRIRAAIVSAEQGYVRDLWSLYQGVLIGDPWIQGLLQTRKLACLEQPITCEPSDEENADDVAAAEAVEDALEALRGFRSLSMSHLMDSILTPVSVAEKIYAPDPESPGRFRLQRVVPVYHHLEDYRAGRLRLHAQAEPDGRVIDEFYDIDTMRHIVHKGNILSLPDNWGGPMRSLLFLWLLRTCNREWWARNAERWNAPIPVGKYPPGDRDAKRQLEAAFSNFLRLGGLVVSDQTAVELIQSAASGSADAFERLQNWAGREIQILIVGQELSSTSQATGLGSGVASLQGRVRDDLADLDIALLSETLTDQLARPHLEINGIRGDVRVKVGATTNYRLASALSEIMPGLASSGIEPTDEGVERIGAAIGIPMQRGARPIAGSHLSTLSTLPTHLRSPSAIRAALASLLRDAG